jgi:hypothetical protein
MFTVDELKKIATKLELYDSLHSAALEYFLFVENHPMADEIKRDMISEIPLGHILDQLESLD